MKLSSGEKKLALLCAVAIALPLSIGLFWNRVNATPVVAIPAYPQAPKPNGYDLYVAAADATVRAKPEVESVNDTRAPNDPKLRAQRYSLARKTAWLKQNQKAFAIFNRAQQTPSLVPSSRSIRSANRGYSKLRQMGRDKTVESNALWMRGNYAGALNSALDTIQMGHDARRGGGLIPDLVGISIGAMGHSATADTVARIDANQAKSAARRLEKLLETRWNLEQVLTEAKYVEQAQYLQIFESKGWRSAFATGLSRANPPLAVRWRVLTIPKQQIIDDIGADTDRRIANARLPYAQKGRPARDFDDPFLTPGSDRERANNARDLVADRLLMLRLALRAYRLENGQYPPALTSLTPKYLQTVPADPFGNGESLRYKLQSANYLLWSIGPDEKDDGGAPISSRFKPGVFEPGGRRYAQPMSIDLEGKGDIIARADD